jgi:hypothetical protein
MLTPETNAQTIDGRSPRLGRSVMGLTSVSFIEESKV